MKKVILLALLMPLPVFGQIIENFESGALKNWIGSSEGRWQADTTESLSGRFSLHHCFDNPDAGTDQAGIEVKNLHPSQGLTTWSFLIRHGYDPSSSNNWSVFLMSDSEPSAMSADGSANGYAIGVNLTGSDDTLRLCKVKGKTVTTVVNSGINWQSAIGTATPVKIVVRRSTEGDWDVSVSKLDNNFIGSGSGTDNELFSQGWFGICYRYSSTRDRLLWLDDISVEGIFYEDNEAPVVTGCDISGKKSVIITFNEEPSDGWMIPENIFLNTPETKPISILMKGSSVFLIEFADEFVNRSSYTLMINEICDVTGNCRMNVQIPFNTVWAETGDVVISEIMADPLPAVALPGKEYIEITNRTEYPFNLENWKLTTGDMNLFFPETVIGPMGMMIICKVQDTSLFAKYGKVTGLKQFPSLTYGGEVLCLYDSLNSLIHGVEYSSGWYGNELKSEGGWSLEMIDTRYPFYYDGNWVASSSRNGGTPGSVNSVKYSNQDNSFTGIMNVFPADSNNITLKFSEPVFNKGSLIRNLKIDGNAINDVYPADPLLREYTVRPGSPLQRGKTYQLDISPDIEDFAGNPVRKRDYIFGLPEPSRSGDILFNELLFNAWPGDPDYIELYNSSDNILDASRLQLVSVNTGTSDTSQIYPVSGEGRCIMPASYYAVTTDSKKTVDRYFSADPEFMFQTGSIPSMADDEGHLILYNRELDILDKVHYNEKMHYSLLSGFEGVALEKISPGDKSEEAGNWHSASESSGWGTPGARNSVFAEVPVTSDKIVMSSSKITPDNDGYEDFLIIKFNLEGNGNVVSASIFDETGNFVKNIATNMLVSPEVSLIWNGTADDGSLVNTGIYIVFITLFDDKGKTEKWKKVCTVIRK